MAIDGTLRVTDAAGFVFDVDGTPRPSPPRLPLPPPAGALEVLDRIRRSGRRLVLFTNGSHVPADEIAHALTKTGLPVASDEVLTPVESAITYLRRYRAGSAVLLFSTDVIRERIAAAGIPPAIGTTPRSCSSPTPTRSTFAFWNGPRTP